MPLTHVNGKTPNQNSPYDIQPTRATYKFEIDDYEMINIDLGVDIMDLGNPAQRIKRVLCAPPKLAMVLRNTLNQLAVANSL